MRPIFESMTVRHMRTGLSDGEQTVNAVAVDKSGTIIAGWSDYQSSALTHSCIKPFHAIALIESGARDLFGLEQEDVVLAASSQGGEDFQRERLARWAKKIGVGAEDIKCGTHTPFSAIAREKILKGGQPVDWLHHNSAGKHLAMLSISMAKNFPLKNYTDRGHPVQQYLWETAAPFFDQDPGSGPYALERCEVPIPYLSLAALARGVSRLCRQAVETPTSAAGQVVHGMLSFPGTITYPKHCMPKLISTMKKKIFTKGGSYAVCIACHIPTLTGLAYKVSDGAGNLQPTTALVPLLRRLGFVDDLEWRELESIASEPIVGSTGKILGITQAFFSGEPLPSISSKAGRSRRRPAAVQQ